MQVGHRHFRSGNQEQIILFAQIHLLFQFGQLTRSRHGGAVGQEGRQDFGITVLLGVQIQHEVDQSPLQPCSLSAQGQKARSGHLGGLAQIQNPQNLTQFPVGTGFESKLRDLSPTSYLHV